MSRSHFLLSDLLAFFPTWRSQMYFKASLTALSHAMEDQVLASSDRPLVIASFQQERFYQQEAHRYQRIADKTDQVYVLCAHETEFRNNSEIYETVAFSKSDCLAQEWHLVVIGAKYASCLICQERTTISTSGSDVVMDNNRRFEGIWTFDRAISQKAAELLFRRILSYRPELKAKIQQAQRQYLYLETDSQREDSSEMSAILPSPTNNPDPFVQRLVTYLQAGQYKLLKANRSLAAKEQKERLINSIMAAIRRSLDSDQILQVAVEKLGEGLGVCRCIVYRCESTDTTAMIDHEYITSDNPSIKGQAWPLRDNPLFQVVVEQQEPLSINDPATSPYIVERTAPEQQDSLKTLVRSCSIVSWLMVPILYQGRLLGMMELHHCQSTSIEWRPEDVALVDAIATQIGVALIQAEAYASLQDLNEQLAALDRTRSNLVAITGHELRTPLSTIQVCLESLASEPDMALEMRQVMLTTALEDAERMRTLVQDFLTLSQLESGRVDWHPESLSLHECVELAFSHVRARNYGNDLPTLENAVPIEFPLVWADGEWLVEVMRKLLDNACKFTDAKGHVKIDVAQKQKQCLAVTIADTGRGIEPNRLETVFDRFYQEEGALRRSTGGTGLGLAICRQIVNNWGGQIWAESQGKDHGSQFYFTIPLANNQPSLSTLKTKGNQQIDNDPSKKKITKITKNKRPKNRGNNS